MNKTVKGARGAEGVGLRCAIENAMRSGSAAKNYAGRIARTCSGIPDRIEDLTEEKREEVLKLAAACRSTKAVAAAMTIDEVPAIDEVPEFDDLFCETYYPVLEDGKRTVGFWSIKDRAVLTPDDVHEWVRDRKTDSKTGKTMVVPVPFGHYWRKNKPDYTLYGVAYDRAQWHKKVVEADGDGGRVSVNTLYGRPPVATTPPEKYGDGEVAKELLHTILARVISDTDEEDAQKKRIGFILDAGAHLLALRDFRPFRCRKMFCFTSTNKGQGTGKSILHESIAALVPLDARCTVPTTELAGVNLLPLYTSSVCILTEAPSTASERYTAEDVKAFCDAGWKTATEKYVAKRSVKDCSLKLMSSNHLSPLPVDSAKSRRLEYFEAAEVDDGGGGLRKTLDDVQERMGWTPDDLRECIGWAFLEVAQNLLDEGYEPVAVARRNIGASHLLLVPDYNYFVVEQGNQGEPDYSGYRDFRTDVGITWSPDKYRYNVLRELSFSTDEWHDELEPHIRDTPPQPPTQPPTQTPPQNNTQDHTGTPPTSYTPKPAQQAASTTEDKQTVYTGLVGGKGLDWKCRVAKRTIEPDPMTLEEIYRLVSSDQGLKQSTEDVNSGKAVKTMVLPQVFPGATFDKFTRRSTLVGFTGLVHVDFDDVSDLSGGALDAASVRDALSELQGFVIGAVSCSGNGAWAIFNTGAEIDTYEKYRAAHSAITSIVESHIGIVSDRGTRHPTKGRSLSYDPDCRIDPCILKTDNPTLPEPFDWKAPSYATVKVPMSAYEPDTKMSVEERARIERFMEAVVENSCLKIQSSVKGERHDEAVRAIANVFLNARQRGIVPLPSWGRRLRDACISVNLPNGEVNDLMGYWRENTGVDA